MRTRDEVYDNEYFRDREDKAEAKEEASIERAERKREDPFWDEYYQDANKHIDYLDKLFRKKD